MKSKLVCNHLPTYIFSAGLDSVIDRVLESVKVILATIFCQLLKKIKFVKVILDTILKLTL